MPSDEVLHAFPQRNPKDQVGIFWEKDIPYQFFIPLPIYGVYKFMYLVEQDTIP